MTYNYFCFLCHKYTMEYDCYVIVSLRWLLVASHGCVGVCTNPSSFPASLDL